jgi:chromate reductase
MEPIEVVAVAGSLRTGSFNRGLLRAAVEMAPDGVAVEILELNTIPMFNQDLEHVALPQAVAHLRTMVQRADALLIATPEYNHTIPGVLGNAIDWLSRRLPTSPLRQKRVALMGAAGGGGSIRAQAALRVPLAHAHAVVLENPIVALYHVERLATDTGDLVDPVSRDAVANLMRSLHSFAVSRNR